jgi:hypothetical protein
MARVKEPAQKSVPLRGSTLYLQFSSQKGSLSDIVSRLGLIS